MDLQKTLVENYLAAVDAQLPPEMRTDVIAELRDTLLSKLEEKEATLGHAPTTAETAAVLKAFGHPLVIANRYRKHQQLIGPEVFPFYVVTLQWTLGLIVFLHIVLAGLSISSAREPVVAIARFWNDTIPGLLGAFAIVTIVFLVIERAGGGRALARSWNPRSLSASPLSRPKQIWETLFEMAFEAVFLLVWTGVIDITVVGSESSFVPPGPIWSTLHTPIAVAVAANFAVSAFQLLQPGRLWPIAAGRVAVTIASVVIVALLIADPMLFDASRAVGHPWAEPAAIWVTRGLKLGLAVAAAIWIFEAFAAVHRAYRTPAAA